ncbi:sporulation membrane protein YtrI [Peribacillus asahii]|uniref:sporulation membrane protein YtrI n=1 Tax=Peribacillus asahii TaxID=228899 RepID=UPI00207AC10B|nr:sporulation membrane protein YtrI [Peribacillus asahii]USK69493.1 sporulation protein [Peribacillus asahii]
MRIPPYHRNPTWQRFLAGAALGSLISWVLFFYLFGIQQERQIVKIQEQEETILNLNQKISIWEEEYHKLNEQTEKGLTIQDVQVKIINGNYYKLDSLSIAETEEAIRDDLASLIAKDVKTIYNGRILLKKSIENKLIDINKKKYRLEVTELIFYTDMYIEVKLERL